MIERLQLIASVLERLRWLIVLLGFGFAVLFGFAVSDTGASGRDDLMMPALAGFIWTVLLYSVARLFRTVPEQPAAHHGWGQRLSLRVKRAALWVLAVLMLLLGLTVLVLSYQLLRTWFMQ